MERSAGSSDSSSGSATSCSRAWRLRSSRATCTAAPKRKARSAPARTSASLRAATRKTSCAASSMDPDGTPRTRRKRQTLAEMVRRHVAQPCSIRPARRRGLQDPAGPRKLGRRRRHEGEYSSGPGLIAKLLQNRHPPPRPMEKPESGASVTTPSGSIRRRSRVIGTHMAATLSMKR